MPALPQLVAARRFAVAGYTAYVLTVVPLLVYPLVVINTLGAAAGGAYFISFQIVTLLNAVVLAVATATYAEAERARTGRRAVVRKGGLTLVACASLGALVMFVLAPLLLRVFGAHYAAEGAWTLRILALATIAAAANYWGAIGLRLSSRFGAMIGVQAVSTAVMLGLGITLAQYGTAWVAAAWGVGHLVGALVGFVVLRTVAPFADTAIGMDSTPAVAAPSSP